MGFDKRVLGRRRRKTRLRLDDPRQNRRYLHGPQDEAVRAARLHAGGVVVRAGRNTVSSFLEAGRAARRHLQGMDVRAEGLQEVGGTLLPDHETFRREVRTPGRGELVVRGLERARHQLLERNGWSQRGAW